MTNLVEPKILGADRLADSLIISFSDGRSASFSAALLYSSLPFATELFVPEDDAENVEMVSPI